VISLRAKAAVLRAQGNWDEAEAVQRKALEKQPHESNRHTEMGLIQMALGKHPDALESFAKARQFAGGSDPSYWIDANRALALIANDKCTEAMNTAQQAKRAYPPEGGFGEESAGLALIAAQSLCGQMAKARDDLRDFRAQPPSLRNLTEVGKVAALAANPKLIDGLRSAANKGGDGDVTTGAR
jgi:tetratricopeptide (TPR) repeat protein